MSVIKCKFIREGKPQGRKYTYYSNIEVAVGDIVELSEGKKGCVVEIDVPVEEILEFGDNAKTITGLWVDEEDKAIEVVEVEIVEDIRSIPLLNELPIKGTESLIVVKQLPVIEQQLMLIKSHIEKNVSYALSMECTDSTVKEIKTMRAELSKDFKKLEEKRKEVKQKVLSPYDAFEEVYKDCVTNIFKPADDKLKARINEVENGLKSQKRVDIASYFEEYKQSKNIDFISFDNTGINVTLTASKKSLKAKVKTFIDKICDDIALIETQEYKAEILVEYKKTLNAAQSITKVVDRHKAIEAEKKKREEKKSLEAEKAETAKKVDEVVEETEKKEVEIKAPEIITPIAPIQEPIIEVTFKVRSSREKLKKLKAFLIEGGYDYE